MDAEKVQDADRKKVHAVPAEEVFVSDALGVTGLAMVLGPNIVTDLAGLPDGSQSQVMLAGGVLVARALLARRLVRAKR